MKGATEFNTETIAGGEQSVNNILRNVRDIANSVGELRRRVFQNGSTSGTKEIRGIQILDAASDSSGQLVFTDELKQALKQFRAALKDTNTPSAINLKDALDKLYGTKDKPEGQLNTLRKTIQKTIADKLKLVSEGGTDIFAGAAPSNFTERKSGGVRYVTYDPKSLKDIQEANKILKTLKVLPTVSLGKLIMIFIGEPLTATHKFDDIQILFYPFNQYAGKASSLNISNFVVDTRYFLSQYTRYRMESASRAGNLTLQDFLTFLSRVILEDYAAPSYGLNSTKANQTWWRTVTSETGDVDTIAVGPNNQQIDSLAAQTRTETLLRNDTPDGSFKMPQVDFYIECLPRTKDVIPQGQSTEGSSSFTILRIHIFDKVSTSYDTQAALLEANREDELRSIGTLPQRSGGNPGVKASQEALANSMIQAALDAQLIEKIQNSNPSMYRIKGGPQRLREFMMKTSPYILVGAQGTAIKSAALSSQQEKELSSIHIQRSFQGSSIDPNGEGPGGLPLQVIPCQLSIASLGCPLVEYATKFFVDFNTGTTIDNYYNCTGITHTIEQGSFTTNLNLAPYDGWGKYRSLISTIHNAQSILNDIQSNINLLPGSTINNNR
jgi:hypothetical protein